MFAVPRSRYTSSDTGPKVGPFATLNLFRAVEKPIRRVGTSLGSPGDEGPPRRSRVFAVLGCALLGAVAGWYSGRK